MLQLAAIGRLAQRHRHTSVVDPLASAPHGGEFVNGTENGGMAELLLGP